MVPKSTQVGEEAIRDSLLDQLEQRDNKIKDLISMDRVKSKDLIAKDGDLRKANKKTVECLAAVRQMQE